MSEDLIGKTIGNYEILRELGRGGMGVVYKANEMSLNRMVALKILPEHLARDEEYLKRFKLEARAAAQLNHPNVVTIYNISNHGDLHFIAMEYVKGSELLDLIKEEGRIEVGRALEIVGKAHVQKREFITELVERSTRSPLLVVTLARPDLLTLLRGAGPGTRVCVEAGYTKENGS